MWFVLASPDRGRPGFFGSPEKCGKKIAERSGGTANLRPRRCAACRLSISGGKEVGSDDYILQPAGRSRAAGFAAAGVRKLEKFPGGENDELSGGDALAASGRSSRAPHDRRKSDTSAASNGLTTDWPGPRAPPLRNGRQKGRRRVRRPAHRRGRARRNSTGGGRGQVSRSARQGYADPIGRPGSCYMPIGGTRIVCPLFGVIFAQPRGKGRKTYSTGTICRLWLYSPRPTASLFKSGK